MEYIFIGLLLGSTVTSSHATREACEGRKVVLTEKGVVGQCVLQSNTFQTIYSGQTIPLSNGVILR